MLYIKDSLYLDIHLLMHGGVLCGCGLKRHFVWMPKDALQMIWKRDKIKKNMGIENLTASSESRNRLRAGMDAKTVSRKISVPKSPSF